MQLPHWLSATGSPEHPLNRHTRRCRGNSPTEKALKGLERFLRETLTAEATAKRRGLWQALDPRVKVVTAVALICLVTFERHPWTLLASYGLTLVFAAASQVAFPSLLARTWGFTLLFAGVMVLPLTLNRVTPGEPLLVLLQTGTNLGFHQLSGPLTITATGCERAAVIILRAGTAASLALLLTLTTPWSRLLKALRALYIPRLVVLILEITLRYVFLLVKVAVETLEARKLRMVGPVDPSEKRAFFAAVLGTIIAKSYALNEAVYDAMRARGYTGEPVLMDRFRLRALDIVWIATAATISGALLYLDRSLL